MRSSGREERAARRELLVEAAADVLRTEGVAGCTARAIAARAGLSKSTIHYYLEDIDELVERGFRRLMDDFINLMETRAAAVVTPSDRVWAAASFYLRMGLTREGRVPMMTFDVMVDAARHGRLVASADVMDRIVTLFRDLVEQTECDDALRKGDVLISALIGILIRNEISPRPLDDVFSDLAATIGIPPPSHPAADLDPRPDGPSLPAYATLRSTRLGTTDSG